MPFFVIQELNDGAIDAGSVLGSAKGEFSDAAVRTKEPTEALNTPHSHDDEEQWTIVLKGRMHFIIDGEEKVCGPGDVAFVPRFVDHCSRAVDETATFFRVKHKLEAQ